MRARCWQAYSVGRPARIEDRARRIGCGGYETGRGRGFLQAAQGPDRVQCFTAGPGGGHTTFLPGPCQCAQGFGRDAVSAGPGGDATWSLVDTVAVVHDNGVKRAAAAVGTRFDALDPEVQRAIRAALDQLAARFGLRGSLVQTWGVARAFNEEFKARSRPGSAALWWRQMPVAFACILYPVGEGQPVVDGVLLFDHEEFEFTPSLDELPRAGWKKAQVRKAEKVDPSSGVLYLDRSTGWDRADVANRQGALPDDLFPQKKMWGY